MMYVIKATIEGAPAYFMALLPNGDAAWSTDRRDAARFAMLRAASDTAAALKVGQAVMWHA